MKRKIIKQANQAYTITLPIEWIRKNRLSEKSEIDLIESGKSILINSQGITEGGKAQFDAENFNTRNLYIHINALYAKGVDEIVITSKKDISSKIMIALSNLIGLALIEQSSGKYIIKDVSGTNYSDLDSIFKRVFQVILLFYESASIDIFGENKETVDSLKSRDAEVNKFCLYLQRAINKSSYPDAINGRTIFAYSVLLEKVSDEIERLWRTNIKYKVKKSKQLKDLIENSKECLNKSFDSYYQFNSNNIQNLFPLREKVREKSLEFNKVDSSTLRFIRHVVKIAEDATDLTHLTLMKNL